MWKMADFIERKCASRKYPQIFKYVRMHDLVNVPSESSGISLLPILLRHKIRTQNMIENCANCTKCAYRFRGQSPREPENGLIIVRIEKRAETQAKKIEIL